LLIGVEDEESESELGSLEFRVMGLRALKKALPGEHLMTAVVPIATIVRYVPSSPFLTFYYILQRGQKLCGTKVCKNNPPF
jgi:hypothetical protein